MRNTKNIILISEIDDVENNTLSCVYDKIMSIKRDLQAVRFCVIYLTRDCEANCWIFDVTSTRYDKIHAIFLSILGASRNKWIETYSGLKRIRLLSEGSLPVKRIANIAAILQIKQEDQIIQCTSVTEEQEIQSIILNDKGWRKRIFDTELIEE